MRQLSNKSKTIFLLIVMVFSLLLGFFWLDYIGIINIGQSVNEIYNREPQLVVDALGDEPSLIEREEFEKRKEKFFERIEALDRREAELIEMESEMEKQKEKNEEISKGLADERNQLAIENKKYSGYRKNVIDLSIKLSSMRPEEAVEIMIKWEDSLIIDVLRQVDVNAQELGKTSVTSYFISLMPRERASQIMYLMTEL